MKPIGFLHSARKLKLEAPRQGSLDQSKEIARITLEQGQNFEQALEDIEGFSHLWLIYTFHLNTTWKAKVKPPRGSKKQRGVFATRSPYRPNPLGLSCVQFIEKQGRHLWVSGSDLIDGTPILDLKPYVIESDSFPRAQQGWLEDRGEKLQIVSSPLYLSQLEWLGRHGLSLLHSTATQQLERDPFDSSSKRVKDLGDGHGVFAYRTWRILFQIGSSTLEINEIQSGYSLKDLMTEADQYEDKQIHRDFQALFGRAESQGERNIRDRTPEL